MKFDIEGARKEGYSDAEIADHLAKQSKFDIAGARREGYSDAEILRHLLQPASHMSVAPATESSNAATVQHKGTLPELEIALINADKAGDTEAARVLAQAILAMRGRNEAAPQPQGILGSIKEAFTGERRTTPEVRAAQESGRTIYDMPESNELSWGLVKSAVGGLLAGSKERGEIFASNFPGVKAQQDAAGNTWLQSAKDGQWYVIPPGFKVEDAPRAVAGVAAFTPAGRATTIPRLAAAGAGTQAAIEATQAAAGGEFNPGDVAIAGGTAAAVPAVAAAARAASQPARQLLDRVRGNPAASPALVSPISTPAASAPLASAPAKPAAPAMTAPELGQAARKAAEGGIGSSRAKQVLAAQSMPDPKTVEAAKRLGIDEYLQPDHVTTNHAYRELAQAVKSVPGSEARAAEVAGLERVAQRADELIEEIGGTQDLSALDAGIKRRMVATQKELEARAEGLYSQLRARIPAKAEAPARSVLQFIERRADDLGGAQNLSPMERTVLRKLSPQSDGRQPTYALLDDVRRDLTAARIKGQGIFKDADSGLVKKLEGELLKDQRAVIEPFGMLDTFDAARSAVAVRKGLEDDLTALFGKRLDQSIVGDLAGAVRTLPQGDASALVRLLTAVPEDMRQTVAASGLNAAFRSAATRGQISFTNYAKWYEGLLRNKRAYAALMSNLPQPARKQLSDLYRVSKGISAATRERITTGRIQAVQAELQGADTLMGNLYGFAKRASLGAAAEAVTAPMGLPGAGLSAGIASALTKGKPNALKATDALIASPEFAAMVNQVGKSGHPAAVRRLALSPAFAQYVRAMGNPREMSDRERWILQAMQASSAVREGQ